MPCGPGLVNVIKKDRNFMAAFHYGDVHVSLLGSYFTACVLFATIYDKSPEGLPSVFHEYKIDKETARILQVTAWETVQQWQKMQKPGKSGSTLKGDKSAPAALYQEKYRPQFHVTARQWAVHKLNPQRREEGWINDINGLVYHKGQYHLFAQRWARCWLHFVSKDLIHWRELQPAFWDDDRFGSGVQSGTVVFDSRNVSGLSPDPTNPPLVAFWSGFDNRSQCISYSVDDGLTWTKYAKNPYMIHAERDPDVFWYEPNKHWVLVLTDHGAYHFFSSKNLLDWTEQNNSLPNSHECPDMFQLPVDGDLNHWKWVVVRGNGKYSIGDFDGPSSRRRSISSPAILGEFLRDSILGQHQRPTGATDPDCLDERGQVSGHAFQPAVELSLRPDSPLVPGGTPDLPTAGQRDRDRLWKTVHLEGQDCHTRRQSAQGCFRRPVRISTCRPSLPARRHLASSAEVKP